MWLINRVYLLTEGTLPCHVLYSFCRETALVTPEIATPSLACLPDCYQCKIGERLFDSLFLFSEVLTFEKAKEYRNSYGRYLRRNQWRDIESEVWMVI